LADARAYHEVGGSSAIDVEAVASVPNQTGRSPALPPPDVGSLWGKNLYDYYTVAFEPSIATRTAWRVTFTAGNAFRASVRKWRDPEDRRAAHLMKNALAVWE
ncbi:MAG: hypothetical protein ACSLE3_11885, partial [Microbacteriaceae bacterium]